ncbi:MAG: prepilin peptidase [Alphaproteobacteria bacterium]|nr:prepilin peptidase [Alphaproteobacteria bacterium]
MEGVPEAFIIALVIITGLVFGSFVTLASYRLPLDEPIGGGRSRCPSCKTFLGVAALVPVFSWLFQRGKCRYCEASVSARYPVTEVAQAALFLAVYCVFGISVQSAVVMLFTVCLLIMIVVDFEWRIIPDEVQIAMLLLGVAFHVISGTPATAVLAGFSVGAVIGLGLYYGYSKLRGIEMLGFGDVKFLMVSGIWMASVSPWPPFLFYAGMMGVITAGFWRLFGKGERFPFGPALAASLLLLLLTPAEVLFYWTVQALFP